MRTAYRSALIVLTLLPTLVMAEVQVQGPVEFGLFESQYHDYKPGERLLTQSAQTIKSTTQIPAKLGTRFGVRFSLAGKKPGEVPLTLMYLTPGVISPDGTRHDKIELRQAIAVNAPQDVMAFEFSERYEVVPGQWRFLVFQGDRLLLEQSFEVQ